MEHADHTHDPILVILSVVIAMVASYTALDLGNRVTESRGKVRLLWLACGSTAMGIGIWSMHFTGMLAFRLPMPIAYDIPFMALSVLIAIAASLLALRVIAQANLALPGLLLAGHLMGGAVAGMHYTGMASLRTAARLTYNPWLVALSILIAVGASIIALRLAVHYRSDLTNRAFLGKLASAGAMGIAIAGLHYTGMAAARFTLLPEGTVGLAEGVLATPGLAALVVTATLVILGFALLAIVIDRWRVKVETEAIVLRRAERELERRVAERTAELVALNRELDAFTYSTSHDLRAPLRGIDGYSTVLLEDYGDALDERAKGYLERIQAGAQRMGELIDDLLELSRLSRAEVRLQELDLSELAHSVLSGLQEREPERRVALEVEAGVKVLGDPRLLRIALENLLENAWKYTRHVGQPCIAFGRAERAQGPVLYVRDNGAGFNMQYADKLFAPFQRLHSPEEFEGTGVGLATVQRVVARHGGSIWAESVPEQGATFYFTLNPNSAQSEPQEQGVRGQPLPQRDL